MNKIAECKKGLTEGTLPGALTGADLQNHMGASEKPNSWACPQRWNETRRMTGSRHSPGDDA